MITRTREKQAKVGLRNTRGRQTKAGLRNTRGKQARIDMERVMGIVSILALLATGLWVSVQGCTFVPLQSPPSVCERIDKGESLLCDIATEHGIRLEDAGNMLMVFNITAVEANAWTAQDARTVFTVLRKTINKEVITGTGVAAIARKYLHESPMLVAAGVMVISPYINYLDVEFPLQPADKRMLDNWIESNLDIIREYP